MIKNLLFSLPAFLLFAPAFAQTKKDSLMSVIAGEVCTEITTNSPSFKNKDDLSASLGLALMPSFTKHQAELKEFFDVDKMNESGMEKFGQEVGMKLVLQCPQFLTMFKDNKSAFVETENQGNNKSILSTVSGTLIKIMPGDFTYFVVKSADGKSAKIWWQEYFKGSEKITTSNLNKAIKVTYTEKDIYNSTLKEYIKQKIATSAE